MSFNKLITLLKDIDNIDIETITSNEGLYIRLSQILNKIKNKNYDYSNYDLVSLIRNILCFEKKQNNIAILNVPKGNLWPSRALWESFNIEVIEENDHFYKIRPNDWKCEWINKNNSDFFSDVYSSVERRPKLRIKSDYAYKDVNDFEFYSSIGQREAIRATVFMDPGTSIVVNLPTGSGKSMVGFINSLLNKNYLTVFVVPTVSLAIDQARQYSNFLNNKDIPLAWHSGIDQSEKQKIKNNIRERKQPIIFTSPEAVCSSLSQVLIDASENKFLKYFIVDECHLVAQWGDNFRPDFQAIAGMKKLFLRHNPELRTILMSATITDETLKTLETLFELSDPPNMISSIFLRGEPQYWVYKTDDNISRPFNKEIATLKKEKVLELIKFGPRPYILYVNEPKAAIEWLKVLKNEGYTRVTTFHGNTKSKDRIKIIQDWNEDKFDGIVATSAFGVGMDKQDIRMIIHACIPESLDRFYQEVGRSGRDGRSSISITVYNSEDYNKAKGLSIPKVITEELGFTRWEKMISNSKEVKNDVLSIDLSITPNYVKKESKENSAWNLRTILLLARAGFIELEAEKLPIIEDNLDEEEKEKLLEEHFNKIFIRIKNPNHKNSKEWEEKVLSERERSYKRAEENFVLLTKYLNGELEISSALSKLYKIYRTNLIVSINKACGGCKKCFEKGETWLPSYPLVIPLKKKNRNEINLLKKITWLNNNEAILITHKLNLSQKKDQEILIKIISELIKLNEIREIITPKALDWLESKKLLDNVPEKFLILSTFDDYKFKTEFNDNTINLPVITILDPYEDIPIPEALLYLNRSLHLIFIDEKVKDNSNQERKLIDTFTNKISFEKLREKLS